MKIPLFRGNTSQNANLNRNEQPLVAIVLYGDKIWGLEFLVSSRGTIEGQFKSLCKFPQEFLFLRSRAASMNIRIWVGPG
jgi:hypothetical protein